MAGVVSENRGKDKNGNRNQENPGNSGNKENRSNADNNENRRNRGRNNENRSRKSAAASSHLPIGNDLNQTWTPRPLFQNSCAFLTQGADPERQSKPDYFAVAMGAFVFSVGPAVEPFPSDTREATNWSATLMYCTVYRNAGFERVD